MRSRSRSFTCRSRVVSPRLLASGWLDQRPPRGPAAHIHVQEWTMLAIRPVDPLATHELRVLGLDSLGRLEQHARIVRVHPAVAVQVGHLPVSVIDVDVRRITELSPAVERATAAAPDSL